MNVYNSEESPYLNQTEVRSKYFSNKTGMDESLSDFQEKKKSCCGPKTKARPKKQIKPIKGQKDIRNIIKSTKNELVTYANAFDKICKQSGLDIDSEQLQTAIALSKSLQQTENFEENIPQSSKTLSTQNRIGKIRTTLQEYGFKIPEIKITEAKSRKLRRSRKSYKLLLTTDIEKQQIISDKYSRVLIQNLDCKRQVENTLQVIPFCYEIATGIAYAQIRDNKTFYIEGLIKRYPHSVGTLPKDWSNIPGRPSSPKTEHSEIKFSNINCNQEELDCVLSGSLKVAQELIKNKYNLVINDIDVNIAEGNYKTLQENCTQSNIKEAKANNPAKMEVEIITIDDCEQNTSTQENRQQSDVEVIDNDTSTLLMTLNTQEVRCCSPDIFDDEVSTIMDNSCSNKIVISHKTPKDSFNINVDLMDLTECVQIGSQKNLIVDESSIKEKPSFQLSQDKTNRRSNDFMELTTVVGYSQPFKLNNIEENIDLTQNSDHENYLTSVSKAEQQKHIEMDLTQSSDSSDNVPFVQLGGTQSSDDTIVISADAYCGIYDSRNSSPVIDYLDNNTKSNEEIDINKELEKVTPNIDTNPARETTSRNPNSINTANPFNESPSHSRNYVINNDVHSITLNSSNDSVENTSIELSLKVCTEEDFPQSKSRSFFEEFIHSHSHSDEANIETKDMSYETPVKSTTVDDKCTGDNVNIDLTQSSDNSLILINVSDEENKTPKISFQNNNLGKIDNVSVDYDEILDDIVSKNSTVSYKDSNASKSIVYDMINENTTAIEKCTKERELSSSQTSEVFEVSDKELEYSIHKSMLEVDNPCGNFDFGGISVVDNLPDLPSIRQSRNHEQSIDNSINRSQNNCFLPFIDMGSVKENISNENNPKESPGGIEASTPFKPKLSHVLNIETPTNGEYVIKTDQVTPMSNYESMTTPERNRELDKYGLKPFKRKRAIQLLTHLYNQTHPILEACTSGDILSPSKIAKHDLETRPRASQKTQISPGKNKSPRKIIEEMDKENYIYEETNLPIIRDIECMEEDWVFQKREKAKVYSCRVPLHIAFHNYVSSRRALLEAILRYEPVNIDDIHKGMSGNGHKYDPKDLLKFMDKKCITVKTADSAKNNRKHY